jgi:NAD(P)-dependent dehydrogenase (short-subunit alcohol dehydrogenase family)
MSEQVVVDVRAPELSVPSGSVETGGPPDARMGLSRGGVADGGENAAAGDGLAAAALADDALAGGGLAGAGVADGGLAAAASGAVAVVLGAAFVAARDAVFRLGPGGGVLLRCTTVDSPALAGALTSLCRSLAREAAPRGVRVNAILAAPGADIAELVGFLGSAASLMCTGAVLEAV